MIDRIELSLPASAELLVLARLTAATVASRAGFDVEEVEDLRLAVDELCISMVEEGAGGRLRIEFVRDAGLIEVSCGHEPEPGGAGSVTGDPTLRDLSARILDALVDEHGRDTRGGQKRAWLRKQRARQEA
ncbi:MAG TPA: ATP-binding protein [Acidimicrobiales bacterium]